MNTKQWAVLLVAMLSFDYATATFFFGGYKGVPKSYGPEKEGYYGWSRGCRCNEGLTSSLDGALKGVRGRIGRGFSRGCKIRDQTVEEYEFNNGLVEGIHKFQRKGPYRCSLSRNYVRVFFLIEYVELFIRYTVSLVGDILTGILGGIGSLIGRILGKVSNLLFRCVIPRVYVTVVLHQSFGGGGLLLEGLYLGSIESISFREEKFKKHEKSFGPYFRPVCDHVLRGVFDEKLKPHFTKHFSEVTVKKEQFIYESSSEETYESSSDESNDYSYSYSNEED